MNPENTVTLVRGNRKKSWFNAKVRCAMWINIRSAEPWHTIGMPFG
ncbi:predicted protein [Plenodomus lingam JN3]|uniref:Predicted protein n=1 Tax=Leptosphaeria maculans (strain JN3 / isolate v23.1.3 / race Av1-4-5-6-7-8) TaxID=985895 RepID=E4ZVC4_LEPMJ|nr:predicted protein [Plenodomus lingam JN3]CBX95550.1 predicted protein [Plenodomus lingam JN3]